MAALFLYLLTDQEWLLEHLLMMEMETVQDMSVFMITTDLRGCKLEQTLMEKQQRIIVVGQFLYLLTVQG